MSQRIKPTMQKIIVRLAEMVVESENREGHGTLHTTTVNGFHLDELRNALDRRYDDRLRCPHCQGDGEEPCAPVDEELGTPLCSVCQGRRTLSLKKALEYYTAED
jgi:hypothetical protein